MTTLIFYIFVPDEGCFYYPFIARLTHIIHRHDDNENNIHSPKSRPIALAPLAGSIDTSSLSIYNSLIRRFSSRTDVKLSAHRAGLPGHASDEQNVSKGNFVHIVPLDPDYSALAGRGTFRPGDKK
jgi:hypothetical protein